MRLRTLANRYTGSRVVHMRQSAVPWAYRVFSRRVGIAPDTDRPPVERIALERLKHGGFRSENLVDDALTIRGRRDGRAGDRARRDRVDAGVTPDTRRTVLAARAVKGVPRISVEEALWAAGEILLGGT